MVRLWITTAATTGAVLLLFACARPSTRPSKADPELVEETLHAYREDFRQCYEREMQVRPKPTAGRVDTEFWVEANGDVKDPKIKSTTLKEPKVESCILNVLRATKFPKITDGGRLRVNYPFKFAPALVE